MILKTFGKTEQIYQSFVTDQGLYILFFICYDVYYQYGPFAQFWIAMLCSSSSYTYLFFRILRGRRLYLESGTKREPLAFWCALIILNAHQIATGAKYKGNPYAVQMCRNTITIYFVFYYFLELYTTWLWGMTTEKTVSEFKS